MAEAGLSWGFQHLPCCASSSDASSAPETPEIWGLWFLPLHVCSSVDSLNIVPQVHQGSRVWTQDTHRLRSQLFSPYLSSLAPAASVSPPLPFRTAAMTLLLPPCPALAWTLWADQVPRPGKGLLSPRPALSALKLCAHCQWEQACFSTTKPNPT